MTGSQSLDPRMIEGIRLFNEREFFDCHEILEELWNDQVEPEKQLTQGIIQIAVAYYHALRGNRVGAERLIIKGLPRVKKFLPEFKTIQLLSFVEAVEKDFESVKSGAEAEKLILPHIYCDII